MELFRLFGRILVDNDDANRSIAQTTERADGLNSNFKNLLENAGKVGGAIATAAGTAALALGTKAITSADNFKKALNGLQASTGVGTEGIEGMKTAMLDIYKNNFGQSFDDIGNSMQSIAQQTGLTGDALKNTTQNALMIRDAFGIDVNESVRAANQLIKNFGIDSNTAYNLIAQGAQKGLNANGNLADTINEYSVHFSQAGLSADKMFNMLSNGAQSGVFDIDKLGDAVKEFGIRAKDGSKGTNEAFTALGLDATSIGGAFAKGGAEAQKAFETVTKKLSEVKDPLKQNTIGVQLFGTMWEDIGAKGITALTTTEGGVNKNIDALGKINAVKYDTFGEAITGIGRQLEAGILIPIGEKIIPILQNMANWFITNMPTIQATVKGVIDNIVSFTLNTIKVLDALTPLFAGITGGAIVFGIYQLAINATTIATILWTAATAAATAVGSAFSAVLAFLLSPIGLVVAAIAALIAIGVLLYKNWDTIKEKSIEIFDSIKVWISEKIDAIKEIFTTAIDKFKEAGKNLFNAVWDGLKDIWTTLSTWVNDIVTKIKDYFINAVTFYKDAGKAVFNAIWDGLKEIWLTLSTWVSDIVNAIKDIFIGTEILEKLKNAGKDIFTYVWNGLKEVWNLVSAWVINTVTAIKDIFISKDILNNFKNAGKDILNNVWDGLKDIWGNISNWVSEKVSWLASQLSFWRSSQTTMSGGTTPKARAVGGPVIKNNTYLVGEKGPELFIPNQTGTIIPNNKLNSSGTNIVINITGNNVMGDREADRFGEIIVNRLKALGVT